MKVFYCYILTQCQNPASQVRPTVRDGREEKRPRPQINSCLRVFSLALVLKSEGVINLFTFGT